MRRCWRVLTVLLLCQGASAGCGTMHNLFAPPEGLPGTISLPSGVGRCVPFGGVGRSALLAMIGPVGGSVGVIDGDTKLVRGESLKDRMATIGAGLWLAGCGLGAIVDTPLSLAGDIVTFPIAYARYKHHPWATWWGVETHGGCWLGRLWPVPEEADQE